MESDHRDRPLTTLDLMLSLPLIALGLIAASPLVQRIAAPRVEVRAMLQASSPMRPVGADVGAFVESLRSIKTIEVIRNDPALASLPARPTLAELQEDVDGHLRIQAIPGTTLLAFAMRADDPARGAAVANAAANTFLRTKRPGQYKVIAPAAPPTTPPSHPRSRLIAAYVVFIPILSLTAPLVVRWSRVYLLDRRAQAYFLEE